MKLSVLNDVALQKKGSAEARVAATPDTVAGYVKSGHSVTVTKGAGAKADFADALYKDAGATIAATNAAAAKTADLVLSVTGGTEKLVAGMRKGSGITGVLSPTDNPKYAAACAKVGVTAYEIASCLGGLGDVYKTQLEIRQAVALMKKRVYRDRDSIRVQ